MGGIERSMKLVMMVSTLLPIPLLAAPLWNDIQVIKDENNQIILTAKCDHIESKIQSLIELSIKIENQTPIKKPEIHRDINDFCSTHITPFIPKIILPLHDSMTAYSGPNCWNTSLFTNQIVPFRRFTSEEEMTYWMNSPVCRELQAYESEKPGDIIAIRQNSSDGPIEMHGFVFLTNDFSFSKSSFSAAFPYEFTSSEQVYQTFALGEYEEYKPDKKCRKVEGKPDANQCPVYANVFRCFSYQQYLDSSHFVSKNEYKKMDFKFLAFEKELSDEVILERPFTKKKGLAFTLKLASLEKEYNRYILSHSPDSVLWDSFKFRIISFRTQIDLLMDELK